MQQLHLVSSGRDLTDAIGIGATCSSTQKVALQFVSERWLVDSVALMMAVAVSAVMPGYGASGYVGALTHALGA
jgi:hypothetical protein